MTRYKLLALDMDGTVLNSRNEISETTCEWIHRATECGITVMFATGREVQSIEPFVRQLGLQSPLVSVNGSEVWAAPGCLKIRHPLANEWVEELYELGRRSSCYYWAYTVKDVCTANNWPERIERSPDDAWLKFRFKCTDPYKLQELHSALSAVGRYELTNSSPHSIEVNPRGINKASGLREVCRMLGIRMEEVIACGDSLNDLKMIQAAGLGVAMGNAQDIVKSAADWVTGTNDEDGVAKVIQTFLLNVNCGSSR
ncbi:HAD family hydrolase [Cohnella fermenti]|uniref:HAD family phosphatase n=1 Tax=Cohnella fermenti TaxID=2565925 RepID=A0A4S4BQ99_9BACL|nr:Cof-type HAD-IIB family hydrolase [Cohnella fermenti]THF77108.1 HAD family phosphatase [Cohnella fermenti]